MKVPPVLLLLALARATSSNEIEQGRQPEIDLKKVLRTFKEFEVVELYLEQDVGQALDSSAAEKDEEDQSEDEPQLRRKRQAVEEFDATSPASRHLVQRLFRATQVNLDLSHA